MSLRINLTAIMVVAVFIITSMLLACSARHGTSMSVSQAREAAQRALPRMTDFEEPLFPDPGLYKIEDVADVDGDGLYEVALSESVEGTLGYIGGIIFQLRDGELTYIKSSRGIQRGRGSAKFEDGHVVVYSDAFGPDDPFCCPSMRAVETYQLILDKEFKLLSIDTTQIEKRY